MTHPSPDGWALPQDECLSTYQLMVRIRKFEDLVGRFHMAGRAPGLVHLCTGQEAVPAGVIPALQDDDFITIYHRCHGHCLAKGASMASVLAELMHRKAGLNLGRSGEAHLSDAAHNNLGATGVVGGNLPIAVGAALSAKQRQTGQVTVSFFGDGVLNQGVLFEALNMAAIWALPVIFVCEDNRYGEFTEGASVTAGGAYSSRGRAFGIPSEIHDGMDVLAVRKAAETALDRARGGDGPSFLVFETYRFTGHHVSDAQDYKADEEAAQWLARDPIPNFRRWLLAETDATEAELQDIEATADAEVAEAATLAEASPDPGPEDLGAHVYAIEAD